MELGMDAALAWDDVGCEATWHLRERAPIGWICYGICVGCGGGCGSARRIRG